MPYHNFILFLEPYVEYGAPPKYWWHIALQKQLVIRHSTDGLITRLRCAECLPPLNGQQTTAVVFGLVL